MCIGFLLLYPLYRYGEANVTMYIYIRSPIAKKEKKRIEELGKENDWRFGRQSRYRFGRESMWRAHKTRYTYWFIRDCAIYISGSRYLIWISTFFLIFPIFLCVNRNDGIHGRYINDMIDISYVQLHIIAYIYVYMDVCVCHRVRQPLNCAWLGWG